MNEQTGGRFAIVFEHLKQAREDLDVCATAPSSSGTAPDKLLSAEELDEIRELRDAIDDVLDPPPMLFTTD